MEHTESYMGVEIRINTSLLASGRNSFAVYLDGRLMTAEINGIDMVETIELALKKARAHIDRQME